MNIRQVCHPVWKYLNQPILDPEIQSHWRPQRFWYFYKINLLEKCWQRDSTSAHYRR